MDDYAYGYQEIILPDSDEFGVVLTEALNDIRAKGYDLVTVNTQIVLLKTTMDLYERPYHVAMIVFGNRGPASNA